MKPRDKDGRTLWSGGVAILKIGLAVAVIVSAAPAAAILWSEVWPTSTFDIGGFLGALLGVIGAYGAAQIPVQAERARLKLEREDAQTLANDRFKSCLLLAIPAANDALNALMAGLDKHEKEKHGGPLDRCFDEFKLYLSSVEANPCWGREDTIDYLPVEARRQVSRFRLMIARAGHTLSVAKRDSHVSGGRYTHSLLIIITAEVLASLHHAAKAVVLLLDEFELPDPPPMSPAEATARRDEVIARIKTSRLAMNYPADALEKTLRFVAP